MTILSYIKLLFIYFGTTSCHLVGGGAWGTPVWVVRVHGEIHRLGISTVNHSYNC